MNYLEYIDSVYRREEKPAFNFLVSGVDPDVRLEVGRHVVESAYNNGRTLFLLDQTQSGFDLSMFGSYRVVDILDGEINLCENMFDVSTLRSSIRMRNFLNAFGFSSVKVMQVIAFLSFVKETESCLGNTQEIDFKTLESYGGLILVKWKLNQLVKSGKLTRENVEYLLTRYTEVSAAAADFEVLLDLLIPFMSGTYPTADMAVYLPLGEFESDKAMQGAICNMLVSFIKRNPDKCSTLILDSGKGNRDCIIDTLNKMPVNAEVHLLSSDIFSLGESDLSSIMNTFPIRIYSRHEAMDQK